MEPNHLNFQKTTKETIVKKTYSLSFFRLKMICLFDFNAVDTMELLVYKSPRDAKKFYCMFGNGRVSPEQ